MDTANINAIISAVSGLAGVGIGAFLAHLKELRAERKKDERDTSYLAILVVSHLDRFANGCLLIANDDGTTEGLPASDDRSYHQTTVRPPEFAPLGINVEWRVLPRQLMYDILAIPGKQEQLQNHLIGVWEFDEPPDYSEFFNRRRRDYAALGLEVAGVAMRLREFAQMPIEAGSPGDWNRNVAMQDVIDKLDAARAAHEKWQAESWTKNKGLPVPPAST